MTTTTSHASSPGGSLADAHGAQQAPHKDSVRVVITQQQVSPIALHAAALASVAQQTKQSTMAPIHAVTSSLTSARAEAPVPVASLPPAAASGAAPQSCPKESAPKPKTSLLVKLTCGAIAGVTGTCIIYPMDMVKTRLQNQSKTVSAGSANTTRYKGAIDAFRTIIRTEGVRGLYKGLPANLIGIIPEKAIKLAVNDYAREYLAVAQFEQQMKKWQSITTAEAAAQVEKLKQRGADVESLSIPRGMLAGAFAGICQVVATNPMEMVKINSQMAALQGNAAKSSLAITRELGIRGLYRGTPATLLRDVPFSFIFFPTSAYIRQAAAERDRKRGGSGKVPFSVVFWSGIGAGVLAAGAVTPADVIKTRLQTRRADGIQYRNFAHVATDIYHKEGLKAFMKGAPQRCMIIAPLFGITLLVYEAQQRYFQ